MTTPEPNFLEVLSKRLKHLKEPKALTVDSELRSLGLDSKDAVDLLLDLEELYDLAFPDELLNDRTFATVGSLWQAIVATRSARSGLA